MSLMTIMLCSFYEELAIEGTIIEPATNRYLPWYSLLRIQLASSGSKHPISNQLNRSCGEWTVSYLHHASMVVEEEEEMEDTIA